MAPRDAENRTPLLRVERLSGGYVPGKNVISGIDFQVAAGEMVGLIGLNGAGKSTVLKHVLGLMKPREGDIRMRGMRLAEHPETYRKTYAWVPESPLLYPELTVREHVRLAAMAYGVSEREAEAETRHLAALFQMESKLDALPAHLSKGMRQKIMLLSALVVRPPLYLIDEPFLGLDPLGIRALLDLLAERKREGAGILICSHILSAIERRCDCFVVLHHGRMMAAGNMADLRARTGMPDGSLDDVFVALVRHAGTEEAEAGRSDAGTNPAGGGTDPADGRKNPTGGGTIPAKGANGK
jgi:ABC-2 type transport system ATP-binding protein